MAAMIRRAGVVPILLLVLAGCGGTSIAPTVEPTPTDDVVLKSGEQAANACERAVLAHAQHHELDDESGRLEEVVFSTCTFAEFDAFNLKTMPNYTYPDTEGYVSRNCDRALSAYKGSKLCETRE